MIDESKMTFEQALKEAQKVLSAIEENNLSDPEAKERLLPFMKAESACRGFFVVLLTQDFKMSDNPPRFLIDLLENAPEHTMTVLTKNLVMSSATKVFHLREGSSANADSSQLVVDRASRLIRLLDSPALKEKLSSMRKSMVKQSQDFAEFLARVKYDDEQIEAALKAIDAVVGDKKHN